MNSVYKAAINKLKYLIINTMDEVEVNCLHIRDELRKQKINKDKIISYVVKIEEAIK